MKGTMVDNNIIKPALYLHWKSKTYHEEWIIVLFSLKRLPLFVFFILNFKWRMVEWTKTTKPSKGIFWHFGKHLKHITVYLSLNSCQATRRDVRNLLWFANQEFIIETWKQKIIQYSMSLRGSVILLDSTGWLTTSLIFQQLYHMQLQLEIYLFL